LQKYKSKIIRGEELWFLPEKAIYWNAKRTLILADWHLGKTEHFRKEGVYAPENLVQADLEQMARLISIYEPIQIIIAGDLFHSRRNDAWRDFADFVGRYSAIKWVLVKGNHDILPLRTYHNCGLEVHHEFLDLEPFRIQHYPEGEGETISNYIISGHIHPAVSIGKGRISRARLACFHLRPSGLTLPAFGLFTGLETIYASKEDEVIGIAGTALMDIPFGA